MCLSESTLDFIVVKYYLNILWISFFLTLFLPFNKKDKINLILTNLEAAFQYIGGQHLLKKKLERRPTN